ncbi:MAG: hypothetical protein ABW252_03805 [Polyangiales bacterium]
MSTRSVSRCSGPTRARVVAALFLFAACSSAQGEARDPVARLEEPASESDPEPIEVASAAASVASAETRALFAAEACDDVYEFRFFGAGGPGRPFAIEPGAEHQPIVQFDAPWGDEAVQAIAFKPLIDNKKVMHHYVVMGGETGWLDTWAPGNEGPVLPDGVGMELPSGPAAIGLNMHYYNLTGTKTELDRSGVAVCIVRGAHLRPKVAAVHMGFAAVASPMVPPNVKGHVVTGSCVAEVTEPVTLFSLFPHMHTRGRHMKLTVTKPDGRVVTLHDGSFAFNEQAAYPIAPGYVIENGDRFTTTCTYDNTSNRSIPFGTSTENEMCFPITEYYPRGALACSSLNGGETTADLDAAEPEASSDDLGIGL